ncbi:MAG TPA: DUF3592 domain-containing protein [Gemmataceae bacterium]|nr:DUF3592 domain-containing protein [Gemmataceae bacterium]
MLTHGIESELQGPTPRSLCLRDRKGAVGRWVGRLFILPHTIIGLFLLGSAVTSTVLFVRVWLFGEEYTTHIVRKTETKGAKGGMHYAFECEFDVDGNVHMIRIPVDKETYAAMKVDDSIDIRALGSSPDRGQWIRLEGRSPLKEALDPWGSALFWNAIVAIFVWIFYVAPIRMWFLVRNGVPTPGVVLSVREIHGKSGKSYVIRYKYTVSDAFGLPGEEFIGTMSSTKSTAACAREGDQVTVLYYPSKPKRSLMYKYAGYKVM